MINRYLADDFEDCIIRNVKENAYYVIKIDVLLFGEFSIAF